MKTKIEAISVSAPGSVVSGDYTAERRKLFAGETVGSLFTKARALEKRGRKR